MDAAAHVWGADGRKGGGWVVAEVLPGEGLRWHDALDARSLLALVGNAVLAMDVPIGLPDHGVREADVEARRELAGGRASSVFAAPVRGVLACTTYAQARPAHPSLSAQTFGLVPRIRDVDQTLRAAGPEVHHHVVEAHPEVSLRRLTGLVLPGKKTAAGAPARLAALQDALGPVPTDVPATAGLDDALDALACAWTALRFAHGDAVTLGGEPDAYGLPMRIVV